MSFVASESISIESTEESSTYNSSEPILEPDLEISGLWLRVCEDVRRFLGGEVFNRWVERLRLTYDAHGRLVLVAASEFERDRVRDNYLKTINLHWQKLDPASRSLRIEVDPLGRNSDSVGTGLVTRPASPSCDDPAQNDSGDHFGRPGIGFQSLVSGASNELALGIAHSLVEGQGPQPLSLVLFHGPNGVGKTHIMQTIEMERPAYAKASVTLGISAEEFMLAFVEGVKRGNTQGLRQKIRRADMLLLDDVHLLKPGSLREFFSHLRVITGRGGQVILTSDAPPEDMPALDTRMRDELQAAVQVPIGRPDTAMRIEIVRVKCRQIAADFPEFVLSDDWINLLAEKLSASGRAVDGAVRSIFASTILVGRPVTLEAVQALIRDEKKITRRPKVETVKEVVAEAFGVSRADMESADRRRSVSLPRQIAMYLSRKMTTCSYPQIGRLFGGKDHTTVIYACEKITDRMDSDTELAVRIQNLELACSEAASRLR